MVKEIATTTIATVRGLPQSTNMLLQVLVMELLMLVLFLRPEMDQILIIHGLMLLYQQVLPIIMIQP